MNKAAIARWLFGVVFIAVGFLAFSTSFFGGILYIIGGIALLPITQKLIPLVINKKIETKWFVITALVLIVIAPQFVRMSEKREFGNKTNNLAPIKSEIKNDKISPEMQEIKANRMAREFIVAYLKDPNSAEFRNQKGFCGEVNAKNSYGGYAGFKRFIATDRSLVVMEDSLPLSEFNDVWQKVCK